MSAKAKTKAGEQWTAERVIELLQQRYDDSNRYAFFTQVASGTGRQAFSWVDAMVVHLWPSDGLTRAAFEVKVSRADFTSELGKPGKNEWARKCCHEFWYVTAPGVVKTESEIPEGCGWLLAQKSRVICKIAAQRKADVVFNESLFASLCRGLQNKHQSDANRARKDILDNSLEVQRLRIAGAAVTAFMHKRGVQYWTLPSVGGKAPDTVVEELTAQMCDASMDAQAVEERRHVLSALESFQERIRDLFEIFAVIAHVGLLERDELGERIVSAWGGVDGGYETLCAKMKERGTPDRKRQKQLRIFRDLLSQASALAGDDGGGNNGKENGHE